MIVKKKKKKKKEKKNALQDPFFASTGKRSILYSFNIDMGLFKEQKKHIKYKTIYIRNIKMKNRNIHSKVISVKLFCREKVLRMYCTFILICWFFANKILCLRPLYF